MKPIRRADVIGKQRSKQYAADLIMDPTFKIGVGRGDRPHLRRHMVLPQSCHHGPGIDAQILVPGTIRNQKIRRHPNQQFMSHQPFGAESHQAGAMSAAIQWYETSELAPRHPNYSQMQSAEDRHPDLF